MTTATTSTGRNGGLMARVFSTRPASREVDLALVIVRIALAWIFIYYGGAKLFGWFDGAGIDGTADFMSDTAGLNPGGFFAVFGGILELGGAIAILVGLGSRLVGIALFGDMVMAMITVTWGHGIHSNVDAGYEINVALAALALVVVLLGAGRYSVDALIERRVAANE